MSIRMQRENTVLARETLVPKTGGNGKIIIFTNFALRQLLVD